MINNILPFFWQQFNSSTIKVRSLRNKILSQMIFHLLNFGKPFSAKRVLQGPERMVVGWRNARTVGWMNETLLAEHLDFSQRQSCDMCTEVKEVENHLTQYFASQTANFYRRGIKLLPEKWQNVIDHNGEYFES
jgi:hypothetical protein